MAVRAKMVVDLIWQELHTCGVSHVAGVAGTQTVSLLDALRRSSLNYIATNTELAASFLAGGFYRASGRPAVLLTIPGPGFTFALPGLAEARDDSAGLIYLLPLREDPRPFASQQHPHREIGELLAKAVLVVESPDEVATIVQKAWRAATQGEPGPVILMVPVEILSSFAPESRNKDLQPVGAEFSQSEVMSLAVEVADRLTSARKPLFFLGQGAAAAANSIRELVEAIRIPVMTTTSGRGVIAESHPLLMPWECIVHGHTAVMQALISESDLIVCLGSKLSHNGSAGYGLEIPADKLVRIDASEGVLSAGQYPADLSVRSSSSMFIESLCNVLQKRNIRSDWQDEELSQWRRRLVRIRAVVPEFQPSLIAGSTRVTMFALFDKLHEIRDPTDIVVTDSGNHQNLVRRYLRVDEPLTLLCPIDYQSMGFALPAAIGARLANPGNRVIAIMGDGGFCMFGLELITAVRYDVDLTVIVFNDRRLSMIGDRQVKHSGHEFGVDVVPPDMAYLSKAVGASYVELGEHWESQLQTAIDSEGVTIVEARLGLPGSVSRRSIATRGLSSLKELSEGLKKLFG